MTHTEKPAYPHACPSMTVLVDDPRFGVTYSPRVRRYALEERGDRGPDDLRTVQRLDYCPWCGSALPSDLSEQWWDAVDAATGGTYELGDPLSTLPAELRTDAWWRGRFDDSGAPIPRTAVESQGVTR